MENGAEMNWDDLKGIAGSEDNKEAYNQVFNSRQKTPYDGIKALWSEVLLLAVEYATGKVTNDHDCAGLAERKEQTVKSSVKFLNGGGNFKLACEAAGMDEKVIRKFGSRYQHLLEV
jgi:hypothetical protein